MNQFYIFLQNWSKNTEVTGSKQLITTDTHTAFGVATSCSVVNKQHSSASQGPSHLRFDGLNICPMLYYLVSHIE